MAKRAKGREGKHYSARIVVLAFFVALPGIAATVILLWLGQHAAETRWTIIGGFVLFYLLILGILHRQVSRPLQTLANMVAALREEDFSFKARGATRSDPLG